MVFLALLFRMSALSNLVISTESGRWIVENARGSFSSGYPETLAIRPQWVHRGLSRDFLLEYDGVPTLIVEVDGYVHHRDRRQTDDWRDEFAGYPTLRIHEESCPPLAWPRRILDADWADPCHGCGVPILGPHSCRESATAAAFLDELRDPS